MEKQKRKKNQIDKQEKILCDYVRLGEEENRKLYASLDSVDQARELPVYVGPTKATLFDSDGSSNLFGSANLPRWTRRPDESGSDF